MQETNKCPELERVCSFIDKDMVIPQEYVFHAERCEICMFWLSYGLAIREAFYKTDRIFFDHRGSTCPETESFKKLLWQSVRNQQFHPLVSEEMMKTIERVPPEEEDGDSQDIWSHQSECDYCRDYYQSICHTASVLRKKYVACIASGQPIMPPKHTAKEIRLSMIQSHLLKFDKNQKPS
ncbi:MAG TPA: hypothetical protein VNG29_02230 [Candidatus Paceibacterota bacterium]|nr:hypothetical protein [Candidatus Paceibacterota bacterium]